MARKRHSVPTQADDPRAQRSLAALQDALLSLIEHKSFDDITIKDITDGAGISYPTFFRRCASKIDLLNHVATGEVRKLLSLGQEALIREGSSANSIPMFAYVASRRKLWTTLLTGGATGAIHDEFRRIAAEIAQGQYSTKPSVPVELAVSLVTSGIVELLTWWLRQPADYPVENVAHLYETLVVDPIMDRFVRT